MTGTIKTSICIIGAGSAGLSIAAVSAQLGVATVLIESRKMGGDCLNYGCVPSKALLACAHRINGAKQAQANASLKNQSLSVQQENIKQYIDDVIAHIAPHDSVERFEGLGVKVIKGEAKFINSRCVQVNEQIIKARYFVIATGSSARIPPIPGIEKVDYLTNESIFNLSTLPKHLLVIGGGAIGCEIAHAYRHLGAKVTIVEAFSLLGRNDPEIVQALKTSFKKQGIAIFENAKILNLTQKADHDYQISIDVDHGEQMIPFSHLLIATGRRPNMESLQLANAKIAYKPQGIITNDRLQTNVKNIYAAGDVTGREQFTHTAGYHASIIIKNIIFRLRAKLDQTIPWVIYTQPEVAHAGGTDLDQCAKRCIKVNIDELDREVAEQQTEGFIKVYLNKKGIVIGATIFAAHAGELLTPWLIMMQQKMKLSKLSNLIVPYPTYSEIMKKVLSAYYKDSFFSKKIKRLVKWLAWLP